MIWLMVALAVVALLAMGVILSSPGMTARRRLKQRKKHLPPSKAAELRVPAFWSSVAAGGATSALNGGDACDDLDGGVGGDGGGGGGDGGDGGGSD